MRVYCGLAASEPAGTSNANEWLTAAVVDDAGRLLDVCDFADDAIGYAELGSLLAERSGGSDGVAVATDSDEHYVSQLLAAAGRPLAIVDDETLTDYADRFADDESADEIDAGPAERHAVGLARALAAGALAASGQVPPREMMALKPVLAAHAAVATGRHGTAIALREVLRELYPAALRAYPDPAEPIPLAILDALPEPGLLGTTSVGRGRDAAVAGELASAGIADAATIADAITALRVAIAETPRRTGIGKGTTTAVAETIREAVAAVRACDAAIDALVGLLGEKAAPKPILAPVPAVSGRASLRAAAAVEPVEAPRAPQRRPRITAAPAPQPVAPIPAPAARAPRATPSPRPAGRPAARPLTTVNTRAAAAVSAPPVAPESTVPPPPPGITPIPPTQRTRVTAKMPPAQPAPAAQAPTRAPSRHTPAVEYAARQAPLTTAAQHAPNHHVSAPPAHHVSAPPAHHVSAPPSYHVSAPPAQQMPVQQMPSQQMPSQQMPSHQMPSHQMPLEQEPAQHLPPAQQMPARHVSAPPAQHVSAPPAQQPTAPRPPAWAADAAPQAPQWAAEAAPQAPAWATEAASGYTSVTYRTVQPQEPRPWHEPQPYEASAYADLYNPDFEPPAYPMAPDVPAPGSRQNWPLNPQSYDDDAVRARTTDEADAHRGELTSIPRQRDGRVMPPWQSDEMPMPVDPAPPALRLVGRDTEPTPARHDSTPARHESAPARLESAPVRHEPVPAPPLAQPATLPRRENVRDHRPYGGQDYDEADGDLLIFAQARSAWFEWPAETETEPEPIRPTWSDIDAGWSAAARVENPEFSGQTDVGLPRRIPAANLVPGSPLPPMTDQSLRIVRDPASMAAHTTGYFRGSRRGEEVRGYAVGGRTGRDSGGGWDFSRDGWDTDRDSGYRSAVNR
jgi:hypothetical protein